MNNQINIFTFAESFAADISRIGKVWRELPFSNYDDTAAALGAVSFMTAKSFLTDITKVNKLVKAVCSETGSGRCTYQACRLREAVGGELDLGSLKLILYTILSAEYEEEYSLSELNAYADLMTEVTQEVLDGKDYDVEVLNCALLCLAGLDDTERYDFAYDTLIPELNSFSLTFPNELQESVDLALEILCKSSSKLSGSIDGTESIVSDPLLYRTLLIAALDAFVNDSSASSDGIFSDFGVDDLDSDDEEYFCDDIEDDLYEDDLLDDDDLEWDEFYSYDE